MKRILIIITILLLATSCKFLDILMPGTEISRNDTGSISVGPGVTTLSLDFASKLRIVRSTGSTINYNIKKMVQAASVVEGDKALDLMVFKVPADATSQTISMGSPKIDQFNIYDISVEGTIEIPPQITVVRARCDSGTLDIDAGDLAFGELDLRVISGGIKARNFSILSNGILTLSSTSGGINALCHTIGKNAKAIITSSSGGSYLDFTTLDQCKITGNVTSGGFYLNNETMTAADISVEVTSGSLKVDTESMVGNGSVIYLNATSGGISFSTSPNNSLIFDLKATSGGIWIDSRYGNHSDHDNEAAFILNGGGNSVKIRATSGGISLR
jgi:hypothetical protein